MKVVWSLRSVRHLEAIHDYIAEDSVDRASRFVARLLAAPERLSDFPQSGREVPEKPGLGLREVLVDSYRIVYPGRSVSRSSRSSAGAAT